MNRSRTFLSLVLVFGPGLIPLAADAAAQVPPDSVPPDSTRADTARTEKLRELQLPDSARQQVPDSLRPAQDSTAAGDSLPPPRNLPRFPDPVPAGFATGVWEWDREGLLTTRALTLAEILDEVPGVIGLRAGDYGKPRAVTAFGLGGGGVRVFRDGIELAPLAGGVADLATIGLGGVASVRVERRGGGLRVELESLRNEDPRPYSLVEVGTGDLDTNLFRGTFSHPRAFGGSIGLALDRIDTEGPSRQEAGASTGGWLRYALHRGDKAGLALDFRRMTADRDTFFDPSEVARTDLGVQGRWELSPGLVVGGFYGKSSIRRAGEAPDDSVPDELNDETRSQLGARVGLEKPWVWSEGRFTTRSGEGWPSSTARFGAGVRPTWLGALEGSVEWEGWDEEGRDATTTDLRGWTRPFQGLSIFGEYEDGRRGVPFPPLPRDTVSADGEEASADSVAPTPRFTDRRFTRYGVLFDRWGLSVGGARLHLRADSLPVLGLPMDEDGMWVEGGARKGFEVFVDAPLFLGPLRVIGSYQDWEDDPEGRWRYFPDRTWEARLSFHDVYLASGDLEIWFDAGVEGRDPMRVPFAAADGTSDGTDGGGDAGTGNGNGEAAPLLEPVPFYQSWYAWLEIRVVTVRVFFRWENLTNKDDNLDFPGTHLPGTRAMYGVRWTLWN